MSRRIDDHGSWAGASNSGGNPLPMGSKMKTIEKQEGIGSITDYPDTEEKIREQQNDNKRQANKNPIKPGQRN